MAYASSSFRVNNHSFFFFLSTIIILNIVFIELTIVGYILNSRSQVLNTNILEYKCFRTACNKKSSNMVYSFHIPIVIAFQIALLNRDLNKF